MLRLSDFLLFLWVFILVSAVVQEEYRAETVHMNLFVENAKSTGHNAGNLKKMKNCLKRFCIILFWFWFFNCLVVTYHLRKTL